MMLRYCFLIILFLCSEIYAVVPKEYKYNPKVPQEVWDNLEKYFLPIDHPIRPKLDLLFSRGRIIQNRDTLTEANFKHIKEGKYTHTICARHSKLDGYVIKFFYDDGPQILDWVQWIRRIEGANAVRRAIDRHHGYDKIFKVAKKWIYPLPNHPFAKPSSNNNHFILIAEDMHVWRRKDSLRKWKTTSMTPLKLKALYKVISEAGLSDSVYAFNIPFAKDGRITFIDTEFYNVWPIHYERLVNYLAPKMQIYWRELTQK